MRYLTLYENFKYIDNICQKYYIENYTINQDGSIDVDGHVNLTDQRLFILPLKFGKVIGNFDCSENNLTSLVGSPIQVLGDYFSCDNNQLKSLKGCTRELSAFYCFTNKLSTLKGGPTKVSSDYNCVDNNIFDFNGFPNPFYGESFFRDNPIDEIVDMVINDNQSKFIRWLLEYDVIREGHKIVGMRLEEAYYMTTKTELDLNGLKFVHYTLI